MGLFSRLTRPRRPIQRTFVYCPICGLEQCANGCFVEDTDLVRYACVQCGTKTEWNFDIAPCPILLRTHAIDGIRLERV